jgi:pimeloyl-ACP methyl ester carboxylesterase
MREDRTKGQAKKHSFWRWAKRLAAGAVALVLVLALAGAVYQSVACALDARRYPPPGRLIDVGGYRLHIDSTGEGSPTVVLDAGWSHCSLNWRLVQPEVAKFTRVCSYDRAGMGWSDAGPAPRTSDQLVRELHALLKAAAIPGPYVLVGHSFGGYNVRLFAHEYPQEVAGLVLVDAAHEDQWSRMPESMKRQDQHLMSQLRAGLPWCRFGILRLFFIPSDPKLPSDLQPVDRALKSRTGYLKTICDEATWMEESAAQVKAAARLPGVPLVVLTAGEISRNPPLGTSGQDYELWRSLWQELQADLAMHCPDNIQTVIANSTHVIQLDQPAAVVEAIRQVVTAVREHKPLRSQGQ